VRPDTFIQERVCAYGYRKRESRPNQLMLAVFFKSVILRTKMQFNKSEVIAL